jgi:hypothetical protein
MKSILADIKNIKSTKKDLRKAGITIAIVLLLIFSFLLFKHKYNQALLISTVILALISLMIPILLKPFHKVWISFSIIMGWFMSRLILTVLFFLVMTPLKMVATIFGKKFLDKTFKTNQNSYWHIRQNKEITKEAFEKQF